MPREKDSPLVDDAHEAIAQRQAAVLIDALTDPETVNRITEAWSGALDKMIGRGMRRIFFHVVGALLLIGAIKFGFLADLLKKLGS